MSVCARVCVSQETTKQEGDKRLLNTHTHQNFHKLGIKKLKMKDTREKESKGKECDFVCVLCALSKLCVCR